MQNSYIYIFLDPDYSEVVEFSFNNINYKFNNRIIYVGKGSFNDKGYNRIRAHFYGKKYIKKHFYYWLDKREKQYGRDFLINNYVIKLIDNLTDEDAFKKEEELVKLLGRNDLGTGTLLNLSDGGMGGVSPSKETIEKISTKNKGKFVGNKNGNYGNGNKYLGELNHSYGKSGKYSVRSKKLFQYGKDGKLIKEYESMNLASKENGFDLKHISRVCKGKCIQAYGYGWSYEKLEEFIFRQHINSNRKKIKQYTIQNVFLRDWESIDLASKTLNINHSSITGVINNKRKTAGNFIWKACLE
ncbi:MAG: hypothetical protein PHN69_02520 [Candidatus Pacebacteria bacterium]|nr:hypothetical protein [Candidatus Paceibacterota bacterium]